MANRLKELREERKLTQEETGKILGIDGTTVSKHENGSRSMSDETVRAYARLYKVETYEIFMEPKNDEGDGDAVNE